MDDLTCEPTTVIENAEIVLRNFSGKKGPYNEAGDRNFCVFLPEDLATHLDRCGYNIRWTKPREEGDEPRPYLQITFKYRARDGRELRPPRIVMMTSRGKTDLDESVVSQLDYVEIIKADLIFRSREWKVGDKFGVKAYLQSLFVTIHEDPLEAKYADVEDVGV